MQLTTLSNLGPFTTVLKKNEKFSLPDADLLLQEIEAIVTNSGDSEIQNFLGALFSTKNLSWNMKIAYFCDLIVKAREGVDNLLIELLSIADFTKFVDQHLIMPNRQVPFIIDKIIPFHRVNSDKCQRLFSTCCNRIRRDLHDIAANVMRALFFLSTPSRFTGIVSVEERISLLEKYYSEMTTAQIDRIFSMGYCANNISWFRKYFSEDIDLSTKNDQFLLNSFILSCVFVRPWMKPIRDAIRHRYVAGDIKDKILTDDFGLFSGILLDAALPSDNRKKYFSGAQKSGKLRVAFCISGQMRGFETSVPTWREALQLDEIDADFYVHTWRNIGRKALNPSHARRVFKDPLAAEFVRLGPSMGNIEKRHPSLLQLFKRNENVDPSVIYHYLNPVALWIDEDEIFPPQTNNQERMCFKWEKSFDLALCNGTDYDLIVRLRPDKKLTKQDSHFKWQDIKKACDDGVVFSDFGPIIRARQGLAIGDQMIVCNPEAARKIFHIWTISHYLRDFELTSFSTHFRPHATPGMITHCAGYEVKQMPGLVLGTNKLDLCDPAPISTELVLEALEKDAEGRRDSMDHALIEAARRTLAAA